MAIAAAVVSVVSGVVGAIGAIQQANAAAAAAEYNAKVQEQQARREEEAGKVESENFRRRQRRLQATALATRGASGADISAGTPLMIDVAMHREVEHSAALVKFGRDERAERLEQAAALSRSEAGNYRTAGLIGAGSSILGGLNSAFQSFSRTSFGSFGTATA